MGDRLGFDTRQVCKGAGGVVVYPVEGKCRGFLLDKNSATAALSRCYVVAPLRLLLC